MQRFDNLENHPLIVSVPVDNLLLDVENPRRTTREVNKNQMDLLLELYTRYDLGDLFASLSEHGYFSEEPLIGIPADEVVDAEDAVDAEPAYIVIEGNRRLAALKILLSDECQRVVKAYNLPTVSEWARERLDPVPVKIYQTRAEVRPYLGVRHIAGIKPWDALAKAKYVKNLIDDGLTLAEVARQVGAGRRTDVVRRWLLTLYTLEQANAVADEPWDEVDQRFGFSWLYTSLGYRDTRDYVGITQETFLDPTETPVPQESVERLVGHMRDLYGPPGEPHNAAIQESRDIRKLASVYANPEAAGMLRAGASLDLAFSKTVSEPVHLIELLRKANLELTEANGIAPHHKGNEDAISTARRCFESAQALVATLVS